MIRSLLVLMTLSSTALSAADRSLKENPELAKYFEAQVSQIENQNSLLQYKTLQDWETAKPKLRSNLMDMLGLLPLPERTPLQPRVTGQIKEAEFRVEKIHFQSSRGLYVTANFYLPNEIEKPLPTILYVCGHARVKKDGVSYGNKAGYQHHGAWFARNGYACLMIDTLQLGEIEGIHHGTYKYNRWWWNARGYTPAGVEAWNCIRALDYLETRPEVDASRFGVTGRSGGGAYSWWIAAVDDRIKCAVPVAGITSLRNHVVDGCVEGHCDCMYMVNTYRWDYATVAALVAPRPLLISNSDKDGIFPLEGVVATHQQTRHIYDLYNKPRQLGLQITEGPHKDTQELRVHAFRWMNRWLKKDESLLEKTATKYFETEQLQVFDTLPKDERNTSIDEEFVSVASPPNAAAIASILNQPSQWHSDTKDVLLQKSFAGWPKESTDVEISLEECPGVRNVEGFPRVTLHRLHMLSEQHASVSMDLISAGENIADDAASIMTNAKSIRMFLADAGQWQQYAAEVVNLKSTNESGQSEFVRAIKESLNAGDVVAVFCPRGIGPHSWVADDRKQIQIRRRFQLIGTTLDAARLWDTRQAVSLLKQSSGAESRIQLEAFGPMGWTAVAAAAFEPDLDSVRVPKLSLVRHELPVFLNADRYISPHVLLAAALFMSPLDVTGGDTQLIKFAESLTSNPKWPGRKPIKNP